jgi:hypothetical protein
MVREEARASRSRYVKGVSVCSLSPLVLYDVLVVVALARHLCARQPFQCDRCRNCFPERDWLAEYKVWHIEIDLDRYFKWLDLYAYLRLLQLLGCRWHSHFRRFTITIKKESHDDDDV